MHERRPMQIKLGGDRAELQGRMLVCSSLCHREVPFLEFKEHPNIYMV